jgi:hypothetical protein
MGFKILAMDHVRMKGEGSRNWGLGSQDMCGMDGECKNQGIECRRWGLMTKDACLRDGGFDGERSDSTHAIIPLPLPSRWTPMIWPATWAACSVLARSTLLQGGEET